MRKVFSVLDDTFAARPYLFGRGFNLADMFLFPVIWFMRLKPESAEMLKASPHLMTWYERVAARPCALETEPPPATAPAPACGSFAD